VTGPVTTGREVLDVVSDVLRKPLEDGIRLVDRQSNVVAFHRLRSDRVRRAWHGRQQTRKRVRIERSSQRHDVGWAVGTAVPLSLILRGHILRASKPVRLHGIPRVGITPQLPQPIADVLRILCRKQTIEDEPTMFVVRLRGSDDE
jgi:hypothetical protein